MKTFSRKLPLVLRQRVHAFHELDTALKVTYPSIGYATMEVSVQLDHISVEGWVHAETQELGAVLCTLLAAKLEVKHIGAVAYSAFGLNIQRNLTDARTGFRRETIEEAHARVVKLLCKRTEFEATIINTTVS